MKILSASTTLAVPPTPFDLYSEVCPAEKIVELRPLRPEINNTINRKDHNWVVTPRSIKHTHKFLYQLYTKLTQQEASAQVYKSSHTSACAILMIHKIDKPNKARFSYDFVARNSKTIMEPPDISDQSCIINTIARYPFRSKIDLSNGYNNIRIHPAHEKHNAFVIPSGTHGTRVMEHDDCNATATVQRIMNNIFRDELGIYLYLYIDDILIFSKTYK